jgi:hypothetical protein
MPSGSDGYDSFRELIQELRREHFDEVAGKVDSILNRVAWMTSAKIGISTWAVSLSRLDGVSP